MQVDADRGAARRHRALRAERLAPAEPPQARPAALHRAQPVPLGRGRTTCAPLHARTSSREARVALFPFAHQFRAGSRIRLTIQAPGGDRPEWTFDTPATDGASREPRSPTTTATRRGSCSRSCRADPTSALTAAPCPSLRAQPCRAYVAPVPTRDRHLLDSAPVSKADKRERQKENRERARIERERLVKRDRQMKTLRGALLIVLRADHRRRSTDHRQRSRAAATAPKTAIDPNKFYTATIDTSEGTMVIALDAKNAPIATNHFVTAPTRSSTTALHRPRRPRLRDPGRLAEV